MLTQKKMLKSSGWSKVSFPTAASPPDTSPPRASSRLATSETWFLKATSSDVSRLREKKTSEIWVWINTYENTIFSGMNIHKSQLF
jgi:hypothetical protein